jgi:hypothetical protein
MFVYRVAKFGVIFTTFYFYFSTKQAWQKNDSFTPYVSFDKSTVLPLMFFFMTTVLPLMFFIIFTTFYFYFSTKQV